MSTGDDSFYEDKNLDTELNKACSTATIDLNTSNMPNTENIIVSDNLKLN